MATPAKRPVHQETLSVVKRARLNADDDSNDSDETSTTPKTSGEDVENEAPFQGDRGTDKESPGQIKAERSEDDIKDMRRTFDYPVFTEEFLFFNRKRDEEVKELHKRKRILEASNAKLKKQVSELDEVVATLTKEAADLSGANKKYETEFASLRAGITALTGAENNGTSEALSGPLSTEAVKDVITKMNMSDPRIRDGLKSIADRLHQTINSVIETS